MNLARVVGNVWATRKDPSLEECKLLIIQPLDGRYQPVGERIAAVDTVGAGPGTGEIVFFVSSKEAAIPMSNPLTPIDAAIVGIVDHIDPDPAQTL